MANKAMTAWTRLTDPVRTAFAELVERVESIKPGGARIRTGVTAGTYGTSTKVPRTTVNEFGEVTGIVEVTITGAAPGGAAGGVLSGTYPNPGFAVDMATQAELDAAIAAGSSPTGAASGDLAGTYPGPTVAAAHWTAPADLLAISTPAVPSVNHTKLFERLNGATIELVRQSVTGAECILCTLSNFVHTNTLTFNLIEP